MTRLPASHTNWPCVILAVDPGASTGAAIVVSRPGLFHVSQVAHVPAGTEGDWLADACEIAIANRLPLVVVAETWTLGRGPNERMGQAALVGLASAWGRWSHLIPAASSRLREAGLYAVRTVRVNAATWHARMLGGGRGVKSAEWKRRAQVRCERGHGITNLTDDAAEALIIAEWSARAGEVGAKLPAKVLKANGIEVARKARKARAA